MSFETAKKFTDLLLRGDNPYIKLVWSTDQNTRMNHRNGCNLTVHRDYANKSCPGDYIYNRLGQIAKEVNQKLGGAPAGPFKAYQGQVNADDGLNCRTAPVSGQVLKTFPDGTVLTITQEDGSWGYCGQGWVCLDYINKIASAKDPAAKEETIMDGKTFKKMYDEINPTYNTIDEVPSYWRADIQELVDKGIISGVGSGKLGLTKSDCKAAVIAKRVGEKLKYADKFCRIAEYIELNSPMVRGAAGCPPNLKPFRLLVFLRYITPIRRYGREERKDDPGVRQKPVGGGLHQRPDDT